jgi:hypothetical protein
VSEKEIMNDKKKWNILVRSTPKSPKQEYPLFLLTCEPVLGMGVYYNGPWGHRHSMGGFGWRRVA